MSTRRKAADKWHSEVSPPLRPTCLGQGTRCPMHKSGFEGRTEEHLHKGGKFVQEHTTEDTPRNKSGLRSRAPDVPSGHGLEARHRMPGLEGKLRNAVLAASKFELLRCVTLSSACTTSCNLQDQEHRSGHLCLRGVLQSGDGVNKIHTYTHVLQRSVGKADKDAAGWKKTWQPPRQ